ncbi:MAG: ABC transporter permease [Butyrivibrio sp.]|nr:ABC transporter permease [Butyrivibrio sp.]
MFFKMLKKDIANKKSLNFILLLFMCFASILTVCSSVMIYVNTIGIKKNQQKVNSAELMIFCDRNFNEIKGTREKSTEWFLDQKGVTDVECVDDIELSPSSVDFVGIDEEDYKLTDEGYYFAFDISMEHDRVTDSESEFFDLPYGTVAVSECIQRIAGVKVGDVVRITTQMGNIYEFKIAVITKDPTFPGGARLLFNKEDFEALKNDSPVVQSCYMIDFDDSITDADDWFNVIKNYVLDESGMESATVYDMTSLAVWHYDKLVIVNVAMIMFSCLAMAMVFMSIYFTVKTAIKDEEKELALLKAMGVDSKAYNLFFMAKYLAVALISAVVGFFGGIWIAEYELKNIEMGQLKPLTIYVVGYAFIASLFCFFLILIFVAISIRRLSKISIIDIISGESRGERFKKTHGIHLYKIKHTDVPFYLAFTDLINGLGRYKFLIPAYALGIALMIFVYEVYNTVHSPDWFACTHAIPKFDFAMELPIEKMEEYLIRGGGYKGAFDIINEELKNADIPAHLEYRITNGVDLIYGEDKKTTLGNIIYGCSYEDEWDTYKGVKPVLRNEVMLEAVAAKKLGINVGDNISLCFYEYKEDDDAVTQYNVTEDFIVTGLCDSFVNSVPGIYMSDAFPICRGGHAEAVGGHIDAPEKMHDTYIEQMREMYGKNCIRTRNEETDRQMAGYDTLFFLLRWGFVPMIGIMMVLLTVLYQAVDMKSGTPEIALLKCCGFSNRSIKAWHVMRSVLISLVSSILAIIFLNTGLHAFIRKSFEKMEYILAYKPVRNIFGLYICFPVVATIVLALIVYMTLGKVGKIEVSKLRDN